MRSKKAKTEVPFSSPGNLASLDDFETSEIVELPTKQNLNKLPSISISSAFKAYFMPRILKG
jgi:hypothetical protein